MASYLYSLVYWPCFFESLCIVLSATLVKYWLDKNAGNYRKNLMYLDKAFCGILTPMFVYNESSRQIHLQFPFINIQYYKP